MNVTQHTVGGRLSAPVTTEFGVILSVATLSRR